MWTTFGKRFIGSRMETRSVLRWGPLPQCSTRLSFSLGHPHCRSRDQDGPGQCIVIRLIHISPPNHLTHMCRPANGRFRAKLCKSWPFAGICPSTKRRRREVGTSVKSTTLFYRVCASDTRTARPRAARRDEKTSAILCDRRPPSLSRLLLGGPSYLAPGPFFCGILRS